MFPNMNSSHHTMSIDKDNKDDLIREIERLRKAVTPSNNEKSRKQAEQTLRKFHNSLEKSSLLALSTNSDGQITFCNTAVCLATGYVKKEIIGKNTFDLLVPTT